MFDTLKQFFLGTSMDFWKNIFKFTFNLINSMFSKIFSDETGLPTDDTAPLEKLPTFDIDGNTNEAE